MTKHIIFFMCWVSFAFAQQNKVNQDAFFPVKTLDKWGFIDAKGAIRIQPQFDAVDNFDTSGYCVVEINNKVGLINREGKFIVNCQYDLLKILNKDLILTKNKGVCSIRNLSDKLLVENVGGNVNILNDGYFTYEKINGIGLGHIERGILTDAVYKNLYSTNKYFTVNDPAGQVGIIDTNGIVIIPTKFDSIESYKNYFIVKHGLYWGAMKPNGDSILSVCYNNIGSFNDKILTVCKNNACRLFSIESKKYILENYRTAEPLDNYIFYTAISRQNGLIDFEGNEVLVGDFSKFEYFAGDIYMVRKTGIHEWGLCDIKKKEMILDMKYSQIETFTDSIVKVLILNQGWGLYNFIKKEMTQTPRYSLINNLNKYKFAAFASGNFWGVFNQKGIQTLEPKYTEIGFFSEHIKAKIKDSLILYYYDNEGNIIESITFDNVKRITVNSISDEIQNGTPISIPQNSGTPNGGFSLNDSLVWTLNKNEKYGIMNINTRKYVLNPIFDSYRVYRTLGFTVAEVKFKKEAVVFSAGQDYNVNSKFLLVSNKTGKAITKLEFLHIELRDFLVDSLPVARCITEGTRYGLINREGKVVLRGMSYIDKFVEGKARCTKTGSIGVSNNKSWSLISAYDFFSSMLFNLRTNFFGKKEGSIVCNGAEWGFIDTTANWIVKPSIHKLQFVKHFCGDRSMVMKNKKWGIIDEYGQIVLPIEYDEISVVPNSNDSLYFVTKNTRSKGCIDNEGNVVLPAQYDKTGQYCEGIIDVCKQGKWGFADENGTEIINCQYNFVQNFSEGLAAVYTKGRWGFVDNTGRYVIKPIYSKVGNFKDGLAWVRQTNGKMAYINTDGEIKFEDKFTIANDMENGIARVKLASKGWCLIDSNGNYLTKPNLKITKIEPFNQYGLAKVKIGTMFKLLSRTGKMIKKCHYTQINNFNEGYAVVRKHGYHNFVLFRNTKFGIIDSTGKLTCRLKFSVLGEINCGLAPFLNSEGKYGFVNSSGKIIIKPEYIKVTPFVAGKAVVYKKHNCSGIIDTNGNYIVAPNLDRIINVSENIALVKSASNTFHFMHEDLQRHSPDNFQAAYNFYNGIAPVKTLNQWGVVNDKGIQMISAKYGKIEKFKNGFANIEINKYQGIVDKTGKEIVPTNYEYLNYVGNDILRLEKDNKVGYMKSNGNWIWRMNE